MCCRESIDNSSQTIMLPSTLDPIFGLRVHSCVIKSDTQFMSTVLGKMVPDIIRFQFYAVSASFLILNIICFHLNDEYKKFHSSFYGIF